MSAGGWSKTRLARMHDVMAGYVNRGEMPGMTQRNWTSPNPPPVCRDFWTLAYQAIDD